MESTLRICTKLNICTAKQIYSRYERTGCLENIVLQLSLYQIICNVTEILLTKGDYLMFNIYVPFKVPNTEILFLWNNNYEWFLNNVLLNIWGFIKHPVFSSLIAPLQRNTQMEEFWTISLHTSFRKPSPKHNSHVEVKTRAIDTMLEAHAHSDE
jgi:hypothetical protein